MCSGSSLATLGLGVDAGLDPPVSRELAARCAALGYGSLWSNDEPAAAGLETLAHFAAGAPGIDLGVGVLPIDRHPPTRIAAEVDRLGLDPARLWLGIGTGRLLPQLGPMRDAIAELRDLLPAVRIMIGTMSPELSRLGGRAADGVLLNWMVPEFAARARTWVADGGAEAGRAPTAALYVRVAVGEGSARRLADEETRYRALTAAHFARMDAPVGVVGVAGADRDAVVDGLAPYRSSVDLPIVRVLAPRDLASLLRVAEAAAPWTT